MLDVIEDIKLRCSFLCFLEENKPLALPMQPMSPPNRHEHLLLSREPSFSTAMSRVSVLQ